jgi:isopentenyl diphosphate isomerase/L-lactate dehydrogenase-like FMN-dependent dehydrogenase
MAPDSNAVRSPRVVNIEDFRRLARRRLPRVVFDYLDGGADAEFTLTENVNAFRKLRFRPRNAVAVSNCNLTARVLGEELSFPAMLAPIGYCRLIHPGGDVVAARAAGEARTGYILSTMSGHKLENVRAASKGPVWYQLYLIGGRNAAESAIERARLSGFSALVITIDTPVAGMRERDARNGMNQLLRSSLLGKLPYIPDILTHPRWLTSFLLDGGLPNLIDVATALSHAAVTWADLRWIRETWRGPIVVKGVLTAEDAMRAKDEGAAGVIVSNHGGRQLDGVSASLHALPEVVSAANGQLEVLMDGGIRRGSDIVKAICMGARAVLVGRAYAYGLAAAGGAGVSHALEILRNDVERTLRLLGCSSVMDLSPSYIDVTHARQ